MGPEPVMCRPRLQSRGFPWPPHRDPSPPPRPLVHHSPRAPLTRGSSSSGLGSLGATGTLRRILPFGALQGLKGPCGLRPRAICPSSSEGPGNLGCRRISGFPELIGKGESFIPTDTRTPSRPFCSQLLPSRSNPVLPLRGLVFLHVLHPLAWTHPHEGTFRQGRGRGLAGRRGETSRKSLPMSSRSKATPSALTPTDSPNQRYGNAPCGPRS